MSEQVLVIDAGKLNAIAPVNGFRRWNNGEMEYILNPELVKFVPRDAAETDESIKQIIPYVIFQCEDQVFAYTRGSGSGEKRLRGKRCIGVGGHINLPDSEFADPYAAGMEREIREEVRSSTRYVQSDGGIIYDPTTEVGRVHVGIVHLMQCDSPSIFSNEDHLDEAGFISIKEARKSIDEFERWSQFCISELLDY